MPNIINDFKDILKNYTVKDNQVILEDEEIISKIETEYQDNFNEFIKELTGSDDYIVSFEASKNGTPHRVPFVTFFNKNFSDSYKEGLFLGFSFYTDKGLVYLKLDQGISSINGDFNMFFVRGEKLRQDYITDIPSEFDFDQTKCAAGNILGKNYTFDDLTIELITEDLKYLLDVYESIIPDYEEIKKQSFNEIVETLNI